MNATVYDSTILFSLTIFVVDFQICPSTHPSTTTDAVATQAATLILILIPNSNPEILPFSTRNVEYDAFHVETDGITLLFVPVFVALSWSDLRRCIIGAVSRAGTCVSRTKSHTFDCPFHAKTHLDSLRIAIPRLHEPETGGRTGLRTKVRVAETSNENIFHSCIAFSCALRLRCCRHESLYFVNTFGVHFALIRCIHR